MYVPRPTTPPFNPRRPFSRAEARAAGLSTDALLSRRFQKLFWDSYVLREVRITPLLRAQAVLKLVPTGSRISHHTAAELWGAAVPKDGNTHVTLPSAHRRQVRRGVKSHCGLEPAQTTLRRGVPISTPEQTFLELAAAGLSLVDLVVVADGMIRSEQTTTQPLIEAATGWQGRGCRVARRAAGLAREGVDSPMETRLRMLIVLAGLPEPRVNLLLRARDGSWQRRYDLAYEHLNLIVEYEGRQHAEDIEQWLTDITRREELDRRRWRIVVVTKEGVYDDPRQTLVRVRDALRECGTVRLRRSFKAEWRVHFPSRSSTSAVA